jgi:hypothetical protein
MPLVDEVAAKLSLLGRMEIVGRCTVPLMLHLRK